jgi:hypothetical protein
VFKAASARAKLPPSLLRFDEDDDIEKSSR